jgi:hypothetical protein
MTILYTKRGRRYYPVAEYDPEAIDMLPYGSHLVAVFPGKRIITYQINPDHAGLMAAIQEHEKELVDAIRAASSESVPNISGTAKERRAIKAYKEVFGSGMLIRTRPSAYGILDALKRAIVTVKGVACQPNQQIK